MAFIRIAAVVLAIMPCLAWGEEQAVEAERAVLVVSQDHAWPPFAWRNHRGEPEGLLIDLWRELGERMGREVRFELVDWPETISLVAEGKAHVHGGLFRSTERERLLDFTSELVPLSTFVFVDVHLPFVEIEDLERMEVGVVASSMELEHMRQHLPAVPLRQFDNNELMVRAGLDGEVSAFVADYPVAMYLLDMQRAPAAFRPMTRLYQGSLHAAVQRGDTELLEAVDAALAELDEADLRRLMQRWMRSEQVEVVPAWLIPVLVGGLLVLMLTLYAGFLLRQRRGLGREVAARTRQLGEQEQLFRTLFENAGAGIFLLQGEHFTAVNAALCELSGYSRQALLRQRLHELIHPDDRDRVIKRARARQRGEDVPRQYQYRIVRSDGEVRWVELTAGVVFMETGPVTVGTLYDLTEHHRLEEQLRASESRFRMLVENASDIVFLLSGDGICEYVSPNWSDRLGHPLDAVRGQPLSDFIHPEDRAAFREFLERVVADSAGSDSVEYRMRDHEEVHRWHVSHAAPVFDEHGRLQGIAGVVRDVDDQRRAEVDRRHQLEFRRLIAEISTDILNAPINRINEVIGRMLERLGGFVRADRAYIYRISDDGQAIYLLHEWCADVSLATDKSQAVLPRSEFPWWFNQALEHMRGNEPFYISDVAGLPESASRERTLFESQQVASLVTMQLQVDEEMIGFFGFDACQPRQWERDLDELLVVLANLLSDVFEKMRLEQELTRTSITDPLTGLYNRRYLLSQLQQAIECYRDQGEPFSLAMLDIDQFKQLNDTHGHLVGDAVLEELANRVVQSARTQDVVGRYGGEEFVILLQGIDMDNAVGVMERMLAAIREQEFSSSRERHRITASAGLVAASEFPADQADTDAMIGRADHRLYRAKQAGRDRLVWQGQA